MKIQTTLFAALLLAGCAQQPSNAADKKAPSAQDMQMSEAQHKQMSNDAKTMPTDATAAGTTASAMGTVEAVDATAGKITIAHGPVEALKWPAMTMGFKATPEQVASVQAGQKVEFEFESKSMDATLTRISPVK